MPTTAPSSDPLGEIETLTRELASLGTVFSAKKITAEEFESLSKQLKVRISNCGIKGLHNGENGRIYCEKVEGRKLC